MECRFGVVFKDIIMTNNIMSFIKFLKKGLIMYKNNNTLTNNIQEKKEKYVKLLTQKSVVVYDIEVFPNFFLLCLYDLQASQFHTFSFLESFTILDTTSLENRLKYYIEREYLFVGFNNLSYDNPVLKTFLKTKSIREAKERSDDIIERGNKVRVRLFPYELDLLQILDRKFSLKEAQCRLGLERIIQEEKEKFQESILIEEQERIIEYCKHDCYSTGLLFLYTEEGKEVTIEKALVKLELASEFLLEDFNYTESRLAEIIFSKAIRKECPGYIPKPTLEAYGHHLVSKDISFQTEKFKKIHEYVLSFYFQYEEENKVRLLGIYKGSIELQNLTINIGIGGLHSVDYSCIEFSDGEQEVINVDVSSYYPSTIIKESISPVGIEHVFLKSYRNTLRDRLNAKKGGEKSKANSYKIVLNAAYGKFKDRNSILYSPLCLLRVTLNCQLYYLMLIERLELGKIRILQVNTDGICVCVRKGEEKNRFIEICKEWEGTTGYSLDYQTLDGILLKDTNNYAWLRDGKIVKSKGKGFLTELTIFRGCDVATCIGKAIRDYFLQQIEVRETIESLAKDRNVLDFLMFKKRNKRVYRFYYAKTQEKIEGVARNVHLAYNLGDLSWEKLDLERYINQARDLVKKLEGKRKVKRKQGRDSAQGREIYIPRALKKLDTWIVWYPQERGTSLSKVPYSCKGFPARTTDISHCVKFSEAGEFLLREYVYVDNEKKQLGGLGFVFFQENQIIGIDIDDCINNNQLSEEVKDIIQRFKSFWEVSPSGRGVHIYVKGSFPKGAKNRKGKYEIYSKDRYFTVTGVQFSDLQYTEVIENQEAIQWFVRKYIGFKKKLSEITSEIGYVEGEVESKSEEVIKKILESKQAEKYKQLLKGEFSYPSQSEADLALCSIIAFYTEDYQVIEYIFSLSQLATRQKWQLRKDYRERTIKKAIKTALEVKRQNRSEEIEEEYFKRLREIKKVENVSCKAIEIIDFREVDTSGNAILISATGTGKTYFLCQKAVEIVQNENLCVTIFTDSISNVDIVYHTITRKLGFQDATKNISTRTEEISTTQLIGKIAISTYAYLGLKGHTTELYKIAIELIQDRVVICDELDRLYYTQLVFEEPLACRVLLTGNTYERIAKCPRRAKKRTDCDSCKLLTKRKRKSEKTNRREFYTEIDITNEAILDTFDVAHLTEPSKYTQVLNSLHIRKVMLEDFLHLEPDMVAYIKRVFENLDNSVIKMQFPYKNNRGEEVFPVYTCVPILSGFHSLPLKQLLGSKRILAATATISSKALEEINSFLNSTIYVNTHKAYSFDVTIFRTVKKLTSTTLKNICLGSNLESMIVFARKTDCESFYKTFSPTINMIMYYERDYEILARHRDYEVLTKHKEENIYSKNLITYARASLLRGSNMSMKQLLVIDCSFILPQITTPFRVQSKEEIYNHLQEDYTVLLKQIIGRILRSDKERQPNTVKDDRKKIVLLYNVEPDFEIELDFDLFHKFSVVDEIFMYENEKGFGILQSIEEVLADKIVSDKRQTEINDLTQKQSKTLSKHQRKLTKEIRQKERRAKEEAKQKVKEEVRKQKQANEQARREAKKQEILKLAKELGSSERVTWREFFRKFHIDRYFEDWELDNLKAYFP